MAISGTLIAGALAAAAKGALIGAGTGAVVSAGTTAIQGGSFGDILKSGAIGAGTGAATGAVGGGLGNLAKAAGVTTKIGNAVSKVTGSIKSTLGISTDVAKAGAEVAGDAVTQAPLPGNPSMTGAPTGGAAGITKVDGLIHTDKIVPGTGTENIASNAKPTNPVNPTGQAGAPTQGASSAGSQVMQTPIKVSTTATQEVGKAGTATTTNGQVTLKGKIETPKTQGSSAQASSTQTTATTAQNAPQAQLKGKLPLPKEPLTNDQKLQIAGYAGQGLLAVGTTAMGAKQAKAANEVSKQGLLFQKQTYEAEKAERDKTKANLKADAYKAYTSSQTFADQLFSENPVSNNLLTNYTSLDNNYSIFGSGLKSSYTDLT